MAGPGQGAVSIRTRFPAVQGREVTVAVAVTRGALDFGPWEQIFLFYQTQNVTNQWLIFNLI